MISAVRLASRAAFISRRGMTTTASASHASTSEGSTSNSRDASLIPLSNVEAQWEKLSKEDQLVVHAQLEEIQKRDWKTLSLDEKRATYYVAFGPHGARTPIDPPGQNLKIFLSVLGLVGISGAIFAGIRAMGPPPPRTMNKEWQEATNEIMLKNKANPITGISSEGYKGPGFVQSK